MVVVIGAGVVGLASALALATRGREVCVLDPHPRPGAEGSSHNSGVVHAGLYYPSGSLKARLCVDGRERLYAFAAAHGVPHVRCGKLVVAQEQEEASLERVRQLATANGARVELVDRAFVTAREPHVSASAALWSPDTGWIDADAFVRVLDAEVKRRDGIVLCGTPLVAAELAPGGGMTVVTPRERIDAAWVVNAAGLYADDVSERLGGSAFRIYPCRGEYAELAPRARHPARSPHRPAPAEGPAAMPGPAPAGPGPAAGSAGTSRLSRRRPAAAAMPR